MSLTWTANTSAVWDRGAASGQRGPMPVSATRAGSEPTLRLLIRHGMVAVLVPLIPVLQLLPDLTDDEVDVPQLFGVPLPVFCVVMAAPTPQSAASLRAAS